MHHITKLKLKNSCRVASVLFSFIAATISFSAKTMVIRHDVKPESYLVNESEYPAIFPLFVDGEVKECVATLIDKEWAVTAAHCTVLIGENTSHKVTINGHDNKVTAVFIPSQFGSFEAIRDKQGNIMEYRENVKDWGYDIALLKLESPVDNVKPVPLYKQTDEIGKRILLLGWGDYATGEKGISVEEPVNDGKFRQAENLITSVDENVLHFDFEPPSSPNALRLEGVNGPGDSGGPALVSTQSGRALVGVSSGGGYEDSSPLISGNPNRYGWKESYIRISKLYPWIKKTMELN
ncbi:S1 family peptidase [Aliikangiella coralliicola]|uniref:Trypsin-like serine protease n=1 Tax=Aliikangiella coralliicola TaxID=2592383 RepID=A0A545UIQ3_9GAMM|nr:trypsin-like serine protease [Aliikangiella coralliicola]TQV89340.1 trypsin-like serine protease [Aliikangiella coralliicola]